MEKHEHSWREWYTSSYQKMRECYGCTEIQQEVRGQWIKVEQEKYSFE